MKVTAFLPVKGQSERIENKNVALLDGEPLFLRTLRKLKQCSEVDEVVLDTESEMIRELAVGVDCKMLFRDQALASNSTDGNALFLNEVVHSDADICVQVLCTSPFLQPETIDQAIRILKTSKEYDSVVGVKREKLYLWDGERPAYDIQHVPNSSTLPETTIEAMSLYAMRRETALALHRRIGEKPFLLTLSPTESIDVNWPEDFALAQLIAIGLREKERALLQNLSSLLSSALLSDILDDLGLEGVLSSRFSANLPMTKVLGRAKTLQIGPVGNASDAHKIYDSLKLYDHVVANDVIVVANEVPQVAFFGELNAHLALRAGAVAAVIDGVTRDQHATTSLGFPVFAKGQYCRDTKNRGMVTGMNTQVQIDGVTIERDDLIFADSDGIVRIPKRVERQVIDEALRRLDAEQQILIDIARGVPALSLVRTHGFF